MARPPIGQPTSQLNGASDSDSDKSSYGNIPISTRHPPLRTNFYPKDQPIHAYLLAALLRSSVPQQKIPHEVSSSRLHLGQRVT
jgi:hypothetical protein